MNLSLFCRAPPFLFLKGHFQKLKPATKHNRKYFCVLVLLFMMLLLFFRQEKGNCFVVLSGSMEPSIPTGSVIFTLSDEEICIGDIITFQKQGTVITHRIDGRTQNGYITKGDANSLVDAGTVSIDQIIGKVLFYIPYLGYLISFFQSFPLLFILICLLCASVSKIIRKENTQKSVSKTL